MAPKPMRLTRCPANVACMSSFPEVPPLHRSGGASGMLRKDAQRNRERLLEVARAHLKRSDDRISLEAIAREAGVGIGTLYRHFPTREDLVAAVYRAERTRLADSAGTLLETHAPLDALRAWFANFAACLGAKREMAEALRPVTSREESRAELAP